MTGEQRGRDRMGEHDHCSMYERAYFDIQKVLDEALGTEEEHGAGGGIAGDVWLLAERERTARWLHAEAAFERGRLQVEVDALHSWKGLMALLDEHWPESIFTGESTDSGPQIVALIREVDRLRREVEFEANAEPWLQTSIVAAVGHGYVNGYNQCECGLPVKTLGVWASHLATMLPCACVSDTQAANLGRGFSRPVCAVHPDPPIDMGWMSLPQDLQDAAVEASKTCPAHGAHPHDGATCLDCSTCRPATCGGLETCSGTPWAEGGEPA